ncbi:hypothetical protein LY78DRAFT_675255 [Colletotrichum sublineola]|nr:hypothetical protein LY78DRAFT_675255 [Colletotrichum sublineola]
MRQTLSWDSPDDDDDDLVPLPPPAIEQSSKLHRDPAVVGSVSSIDLYKGFVGEITSIHHATLVDQLRPIVKEILLSFEDEDAARVSTHFVIDGPKLRRANRIVEQGLSEEARRRRIHEARNANRRSRRNQQLPGVQATVRRMCGRNAQLPDGTLITSLSFQSCKTFIRIINSAQSQGMSVYSLWHEPSGILFDTKYTTRALESAYHYHFGSDNNSKKSQETKVISRDQQGEDDCDASKAEDYFDYNTAGADDNNDDDHDEDGGALDCNHVQAKNQKLDQLKQEEPNDPEEPEDERRAPQSFPSSPSPLPLDLSTSPLLTPQPKRLWIQDIEHTSGLDGKPHQLPDRPTLDLAVIQPDPQTVSDVKTNNTASPLGHSRKLSLQHPIQQQPINQHMDKSPSQQIGDETPTIDSLPAAQSSTESVEAVPSAPSAKRRSELERALPTSKRCRINVHQTEVDLKRLTSGQCLNDAEVFALMKIVAALCPLSVHVLDPLLTDGSCVRLPARVKDALPKLTEGIVLAPLHLKSAYHWILAVPRPNSTCILDSLPSEGSRTELTSKVNHLRGLLRDGDDETAVGDNTEHSAFPMEYIGCTRQINGTNCGVAVIVNAVQILSGSSTSYDKPSDFSVWRRVLAALANADTGVSLVNKQDFASLFTAVPTPSMLGPQPAAHPEHMTSLECEQWCSAIMDYVGSLGAWKNKQMQHTEAAHVQMLQVLGNIGNTLAQLRQAGTLQWKPGFSLKAANSGPQPLNPLQNEIEEAIWCYECAYSAFSNSRFADRDRNGSLMRGLDDLRQLNVKRSDTLSRLDRVTAIINTDVEWLRQTGGPEAETRGGEAQELKMN